MADVSYPSVPVYEVYGRLVAQVPGAVQYSFPDSLGLQSFAFPVGVQRVSVKCSTEWYLGAYDAAAGTSDAPEASNEGDDPTLDTTVAKFRASLDDNDFVELNLFNGGRPVRVHKTGEAASTTYMAGGLMMIGCTSAGATFTFLFELKD